MTDFEKIKKALLEGGHIEDRNVFFYESENVKTISLYKTYYQDYYCENEIETEFSFDLEGNLINII